jgi:hypothetical protein
MLGRQWTVRLQIYKTLHDTRTKLRRVLAEAGYLEENV